MPGKLSFCIRTGMQSGIVNRSRIGGADAGEIVARDQKVAVAVDEALLAVIDHLAVLRGGTLGDLISGYRSSAAIGQVDRDDR
jgi:hypothetical protein